MEIFILDENDSFIKMVVISGNPHSVSWSAKVYSRIKETGKWKFASKVSFESSLRNGLKFNLDNDTRVISRFYIRPKI